MCNLYNKTEKPFWVMVFQLFISKNKALQLILNLIMYFKENTIGENKKF